MRYLTLVLMLAVLGCAPAKEGDWIDREWPRRSEDWKRGYRDYFSEVGKDFKGSLNEIHTYWYRIQLSQQSASDKSSSDSYIAEKKREIADLLQSIQAETQKALTARKKLQRGAKDAAEYWDGWQMAEMETSNSVFMQKFREDEKAREEGKHLKKVLEYAR